MRTSSLLKMRITGADCRQQRLHSLRIGSMRVRERNGNSSQGELNQERRTRVFALHLPSRRNAVISVYDTFFDPP
jgi:hypothetical protein